MNITLASQSDFEPILALLQSSNLPTTDLTENHLSQFYVATDTNKIVGVAGLEIYDACGLLRSVAVADSHRNLHIAQKLTSTIEHHAKEAGLEQIFLITTTADAYFSKHNYQKLNRDEVPLAIAQTSQFSGLCPSSAIVMSKKL